MRRLGRPSSWGRKGCGGIRSWQAIAEETGNLSPGRESPGCPGRETGFPPVGIFKSLNQLVKGKYILCREGVDAFAG